MIMIDPPSGWRYGFPKEFTREENQSVEEWLLANGYPQEEINACGEYFYCRYWEVDAIANSNI